MKTRHFKSLLDINQKEFIRIIERSIELKKLSQKNNLPDSLAKKTLALIFKKNSTRTRVSLETAMAKLGGNSIYISHDTSQMSRGESIQDTGKVLSGMVDIVAIRTHDHKEVEDLCDSSKIPVINALTEKFHPCQLLADMQTFYEERGSFENKTFSWVGDGCNMCNSYINASKILGFNLKIATPNGFEPDLKILASASDTVELCDLPGKAVENSDLVTTDVWSSMGDEDDAERRKVLFKGYQINQSLMDKAKNDAIFLHCLPAHRGEEVSSEVIDGINSKVWQQAHNRLFTAQALIEFLLEENI
tara:strand:- start:171 stop:1082 length:912 start_codon:yes stop_codon:yes gene_type:complete